MNIFKIKFYEQNDVVYTIEADRYEVYSTTEGRGIDFFVDDKIIASFFPALAIWRVGSTDGSLTMNDK